MTGMKISTAQFFRSNANAMSNGQFEVSSLQAKLGTGEQLNAPSEDPIKANFISRLESSLKRQEVYQKNIETAKTRLTSEETALTSITNLFRRAYEIAIIGANGTMAPEDRAVLGAEVASLRKELIELANTKDVSGHFIFAGNRTEAPPYVESSNGDVSYVGDFGTLRINVSDNRSIALNTVGHELLTGADFSVVQVLEQGLKTNDVAAISSSIGDLKNSSDQIAVAFGSMGGRFSSLTAQTEALEDTSLRIEQLISQNRDLDYSKAITELSKESLALQALQASFTKISQLSLFNFLR